MKFLIQSIEGEIVHDFSFTLIEAIKYQNWFNTSKDKSSYITYKITENKLLAGYIPVGTTEFVSSYLEKHFNLTPKPINIPLQLNEWKYLKRNIRFGPKEHIKEKCFIKSMDKIKKFTDIVNGPDMVPDGNYLISEIIDIESEWRAFVYKDKLVGINNYSGEFTMFPDINIINDMIKSYTDKPIACTIDVGINKTGTFLIEVHDFFSCGLYGFSDSRIYPNMLSSWFNEYLRKNNKNGIQ
jgi:hypothetical protein